MPVQRGYTCARAPHPSPRASVPASHRRGLPRAPPRLARTCPPRVLTRARAHVRASVHRIERLYEENPALAGASGCCSDPMAHMPPPPHRGPGDCLPRTPTTATACVGGGAGAGATGGGTETTMMGAAAVSSSASRRQSAPPPPAGGLPGAQPIASRGRSLTMSSTASVRAEPSSLPPPQSSGGGGARSKATRLQGWLRKAPSWRQDPRHPTLAVGGAGKGVGVEALPTLSLVLPQSRYFVLRADGTLTYYRQKEEFDLDLEPRASLVPRPRAVRTPPDAVPRAAPRRSRRECAAWRRVRWRSPCKGTRRVSPETQRVRSSL